MVDFFQFALSSPVNFLGTLAIIMVTGLSIGMALAPFGRPRSMNVFPGGIEDDCED
jgi:hypothetical protein